MNDAAQIQNDLDALQKVVDDSKYALSVLEDVQGLLFRLSEELEEKGEGTLAGDVRVSQHALETVRERLERASGTAQELNEGRS
ncbi:hypothetical protein SRM_p11012 (plasmid) [Salinibacter ruber M8]|uniref:Uncharacterized protein n=1 Tax=Salinibacter ruber (strain M8) TaxID=761659 RepID=D5H477_SALRM|nr:hypothetical protein [Salinibacter ruber]CBH22717.1 hypothetical protein SRM_p11012 [Salinibacter ruber M8]